MKTGLKRDVINAFLAATAGIVAMEAYQLPDRAKNEAVITEQQSALRRVTGEKVECLLSKETAGQQDKQSDEETVPVSVYKNLEHEFYYNLSVNCQFGYDPVVLVSKEGQGCNNSRMLNAYMDKMHRQCSRAMEFAKTPEEQNVLKNSKEHYVALRADRHISPGKCGTPKEFE